MALDCPKCVGKMETEKVGEVELDRCFICHGYWFDRGELEKVLTTHAPLFWDEWVDSLPEAEDAGEIDLNRKAGKCPRCPDHTPLEASQMGSLRVDMCPRDHGVFLDRGELARLELSGIHAKIERFKDGLRRLFHREGRADDSSLDPQ